MLKRFRVEQGSDNDVVVVPVDVIREATEVVFRICGMTVRWILGYLIRFIEPLLFKNNYHYEDTVIIHIHIILYVWLEIFCYSVCWCSDCEWFERKW